jgi:hypothetical protein
LIIKINHKFQTVHNKISNKDNQIKKIKNLRQKFVKIGCLIYVNMKKNVTLLMVRKNYMRNKSQNNTDKDFANNFM